MLVCTMAPVGTGVLKAVDPSATVGATAGTSAVGVLPRWQASHCALMGEGMCALLPAGLVAGNTTAILSLLRRYQSLRHFDAVPL